MIKTCPICAREFEPSRSSQKFCSADCRLLNNNRQNRERMRVKRGSFTPHPCVDCSAPIIGRSKRCDRCKKEENKRQQREHKARNKAKCNKTRREYFKNNPEAVRRAQRKKIENLKKDPERYKVFLDNARRRCREHRQRIRAEKERAALFNLSNPNDNDTVN